MSTVLKNKLKKNVYKEIDPKAGIWERKKEKKEEEMKWELIGLRKKMEEKGISELNKV